MRKRHEDVESIVERLEVEHPQVADEVPADEGLDPPDGEAPGREEGVAATLGAGFMSDAELIPFLEEIRTLHGELRQACEALQKSEEKRTQLQIHVAEARALAHRIAAGVPAVVPPRFGLDEPPGSAATTVVGEPTSPHLSCALNSL